jgi:protein TonB
LGKFGFLGVFIIVAVVHFFALQSYIAKQNAISKPKAKVHRITLSRVQVKKPVPIPPKPKVEPIILPPDPEPKPIVKPKPKPKPKPKRKKIVKKPKKVEPVIVPAPVPEPIIEEPIVEQVIAPIETIDTTSIKDEYTSEIRRKIRENLFYPKMAKRLRMQGIVEVAFRVLKDGQITNIRILNSPKKLLGKGARKTLQRVSLRPIPDELKEQHMDITIPIEFRLIRR